MAKGFANPITQKIAEFLRSIGIEVESSNLAEGCFLPGICIREGLLLVDEARLQWPGDLLHEAAHLALAPAERRRNLADDASVDGGEELGSLAWSWAALTYIGLDAEVVFHKGGYKGESESIIQNFREGRFIGVPFLRWVGLAGDDYPAMLKWLRD